MRYVCRHAYDDLGETAVDFEADSPMEAALLYALAEYRDRPFKFLKVAVTAPNTAQFDWMISSADEHFKKVLRDHTTDGPDTSN